MTKPDLALSQIAARFTRHDVEWSRGAFMIIDRRTANPIARLRPIPDTDRFELFYWSNVKGRWTTFGNLGRMKLMLESAHEIVESDPMFRIPRGRQACSELAKVKLRPRKKERELAALEDISKSNAEAIEAM
jgi:hypothetical protein